MKTFVMFIFDSLVSLVICAVAAVLREHAIEAIPISMIIGLFILPAVAVYTFVVPKAKSILYWMIILAESGYWLLLYISARQQLMKEGVGDGSDDWAMFFLSVTIMTGIGTYIWLILRRKGIIGPKIS